MVAAGNNQSESYTDLIGAIGSAGAAIAAVIAAGISFYAIKIANNTSIMNEKFFLYSEATAIVHLQKEFAYKSQKARMSLNLSNNATPQEIALFNSTVIDYQDNESNSITEISGLTKFLQDIAKAKRLKQLEYLRVRSNKFRMNIVAYELKLNVLVIKSKNNNFLPQTFFL